MYSVQYKFPYLSLLSEFSQEYTKTNIAEQKISGFITKKIKEQRDDLFNCLHDADEKKRAFNIKYNKGIFTILYNPKISLDNDSFQQYPQISSEADLISICDNWVYKLPTKFCLCSSDNYNNIKCCDMVSCDTDSSVIIKKIALYPNDIENNEYPTCNGFSLMNHVLLCETGSVSKDILPLNKSSNWLKLRGISVACVPDSESKLILVMVSKSLIENNEPVQAHRQFLDNKSEQEKDSFNPFNTKYNRILFP